MKKKRFRIMAALLSMLMVAGVVPLNAFAWGTQGQVCSSAFGDKYVGSDGDNYYSASTYDYLVYDNEGNTTKHTKSAEPFRGSALLPAARR